MSARFAAGILVCLGFSVAAPLAASTNFTPVIDGGKEAAWGTTPDATSTSGYNKDGADDGPCRDLYITDDPQYLYLLYWYRGDKDNVDNKSAHTLIAIDTTNSYGGSTDTYIPTTTFSGTLPDFIVRSYHQVQSGYKDIQLVKWNGSSWSFLGSFGDAEHAENINGWAEIRIPLTTLKVKTGSVIKVVQYWRYDEFRAGFSDSTPYNSTASDYSATGAAISTFVNYTIQADNIVPVITASSPAHASTGVAKSASIVFSVRDNVGFTPDKVTVTVEGNDAWKNGAAQAGYAVTIVTNNATNYQFTINPSADFAFEQRVDVTVAALDKAGNTSAKTYYYDVAADATAPVYAGLSPARNATGVAINANVLFGIGDDDQVNPSSVTVLVNGTVAYTNGSFVNSFSGSRVVNGAGYDFTVDPPADFAWEQVVPVAVTARDMKGNARATNWSFTVKADDVPPTIASQNPADGAVNVAKTATLSFQLADNVQVVSNMISLSVGGVSAVTNGAFKPGYSGSIVANGTGWTVTVNHAAAFAYAQLVTVRAWWQDGKANAQTATWSFTVKADDAAPTIADRAPAANTTGLARATAVSFTVDDDTQVNLSTLNVQIAGESAVVGGGSQAGYSLATTVTNHGYRVTVTRAAPFAYDQVVSVAVSAQDGSGNQQSGSWSFTVKADDVAPWLGTLSPAAGGTGILPTANVQLSIVDDSGVDPASVVVRINGQLALTNGTFQAPYDGALSQLATAGAAVNLVLDRTAAWPYRGVNTVAVAARDARGNQLSTSYAFTVKADDVAPAFANLAPGSGSSGVSTLPTVTFDVTDNTNVDAASLVVLLRTNAGEPWRTVLTNGAFQPGFTGGSVVPNAAHGWTVSFAPAVAFGFQSLVSLYLAARDGEGNLTTLATWNFQVQDGDATPPTISKLSPYNGQAGVEPDAVLHFETADNSQVSSNLLWARIRFPNGSEYEVLTNGVFKPGFNGPASRIVSNAFRGFDVDVDYTGQFDFTNTYTVTVGARDYSGTGNPVTATWSFTVRPPDTAAPAITMLTPLAGAVDVPVSTSFSFLVSDNYGVLVSAVSLSVNGVVALTNGVFQPGYDGPGSSLVANAAHGWNVTVDPTRDLPLGGYVDLQVRAADTSGNTALANVRCRPLEASPARATTNVIDPKRGTGKATIKLNRTGTLTVDVYNLRGEKVHSFPASYYNAGDLVEWDGSLRDGGRKVAPGWYFVRVAGADFSTTVRVLVTR